MITKIQAYKSSDGTAHPSLEEAQLHEVRALLTKESIVTLPDVPDIAALICKNRDKLIDILTTTTTSKPRARKINGGTKKRTKPESHTLPFTETTQPAA